MSNIKQIIVQPDVNPNNIAISFAIGLSIAFTPLIGLHTLIAIVICIIFKKLNKPLTLLACYINNPWTMIPITSISILIGKLILGNNNQLYIEDIHWNKIGLHSFISRNGLINMYITLKPIIKPYLLGGFILSALALVTGYYVMLVIIKRLRTLKTR